VAKLKDMYKTHYLSAVCIYIWHCLWIIVETKLRINEYNTYFMKIVCSNVV
jgi:hypothetical protein